MTFAQDWQHWHDEHEARRAAPHGFLAVTGLHWLDATPRRIPGIPGSWATGPGGVGVTLADGEHLTAADGTRLTGEHRFPPLAERTDVLVTSGDTVIEIARRGGFDVVRPRDPRHPLRTSYTGTPTYPPSPDWVVTGRYAPFDPPRPLTVGAAVEGIEHVYDAVGRVTFELGGRELALTVFAGHTPGTLNALFTDATSGVTTYAANRSLSIPAPGSDGAVVLDFNRAVNLPCAYTDFATCPLPPAENRLPVPVEAGEQTPRERHTAATAAPALSASS